MSENNNDITRREVLGTTAAVMLYSSIGVSEAKGNKKSGKTPSHTVPHDVFIANNGDEKHELNFSLIDKKSSEVKYEHKVLLPDLNDESRNKAKSVKKKLNINVPTGQEYRVNMENNNGTSATTKWYIPEEGTDHISISAYISPDEEISLIEKIA